jgi:hypothetical protein
MIAISGFPPDILTTLHPALEVFGAIAEGFLALLSAI